MPAEIIIARLVSLDVVLFVRECRESVTRRRMSRRQALDISEVEEAHRL